MSRQVLSFIQIISWMKCDSERVLFSFIVIESKVCVDHNALIPGPCDTRYLWLNQDDWPVVLCAVVKICNWNLILLSHSGCCQWIIYDGIIHRPNHSRRRLNMSWSRNATADLVKLSRFKANHNFTFQLMRFWKMYLLHKSIRFTANDLQRAKMQLTEHIHREKASLLFKN